MVSWISFSQNWTIFLLSIHLLQSSSAHPRKQQEISKKKQHVLTATAKRLDHSFICTFRLRLGVCFFQMQTLWLSGARKSSSGNITSATGNAWRQILSATPKEYRTSVLKEDSEVCGRKCRTESPQRWMLTKALGEWLWTKTFSNPTSSLCYYRTHRDCCGCVHCTQYCSYQVICLRKKGVFIWQAESPLMSAWPRLKTIHLCIMSAMNSDFPICSLL